MRRVNSDLFNKGKRHERDKETTGKDGRRYKLEAKAGWIRLNSPDPYRSHQFTIEAFFRSSRIGWVNFEDKGAHLEAKDVQVIDRHRRNGVATEMYKFARELGNCIKPSSQQRPLGKAFWSVINHGAHDK